MHPRSASCKDGESVNVQKRSSHEGSAGGSAASTSSQSNIAAVRQNLLRAKARQGRDSAIAEPCREDNGTATVAMLANMPDSQQRRQLRGLKALSLLSINPQPLVATQSNPQRLPLHTAPSALASDATLPFPHVGSDPTVKLSLASIRTRSVTPVLRAGATAVSPTTKLHLRRRSTPATSPTSGSPRRNNNSSSANTSSICANHSTRLPSPSPLLLRRRRQANDMSAITRNAGEDTLAGEALARPAEDGGAGTIDRTEALGDKTVSRPHAEACVPANLSSTAATASGKATTIRGKRTTVNGSDTASPAPSTGLSPAMCDPAAGQSQRILNSNTCRGSSAVAAAEKTSASALPRNVDPSSASDATSNPSAISLQSLLPLTGTEATLATFAEEEEEGGKEQVLPAQSRPPSKPAASGGPLLQDSAHVEGRGRRLSCTAATARATAASAGPAGKKASPVAKWTGATSATECSLNPTASAGGSLMDKWSLSAHQQSFLRTVAGMAASAAAEAEGVDDGQSRWQKRKAVTGALTLAGMSGNSNGSSSSTNLHRGGVVFVATVPAQLSPSEGQAGASQSTNNTVHSFEDDGANSSMKTALTQLTATTNTLGATTSGTTNMTNTTNMDHRNSRAISALVDIAGEEEDLAVSPNMKIGAASGTNINTELEEAEGQGDKKVSAERAEVTVPAVLDADPFTAWQSSSAEQKAASSPLSRGPVDVEEEARGEDGRAAGADSTAEPIDVLGRHSMALSIATENSVGGADASPPSTAALLPTNSRSRGILAAPTTAGAAAAAVRPVPVPSAATTMSPHSLSRDGLAMTLTTDERETPLNGGDGAARSQLSLFLPFQLPVISNHSHVAALPTSAEYSASFTNFLPTSGAPFMITATPAAVSSSVTSASQMPRPMEALVGSALDIPPPPPPSFRRGSDGAGVGAAAAGFPPPPAVGHRQSLDSNKDINARSFISEYELYLSSFDSINSWNRSTSNYHNNNNSGSGGGKKAQQQQRTKQLEDSMLAGSDGCRRELAVSPQMRNSVASSTCATQIFNTAPAAVSSTLSALGSHSPSLLARRATATEARLQQQSRKNDLSCLFTSVLTVDAEGEQTAPEPRVREQNKEGHNGADFVFIPGPLSHTEQASSPSAVATGLPRSSPNRRESGGRGTDSGHASSSNKGRTSSALKSTGAAAATTAASDEDDGDGSVSSPQPQHVTFADPTQSRNGTERNREGAQEGTRNEEESSTHHASSPFAAEDGADRQSRRLVSFTTSERGVAGRRSKPGQDAWDRGETGQEEDERGGRGQETVSRTGGSCMDVSSASMGSGSSTLGSRMRSSVDSLLFALHNGDFGSHYRIYPPSSHTSSQQQLDISGLESAGATPLAPYVKDATATAVEASDGRADNSNDNSISRKGASDFFACGGSSGLTDAKGLGRPCARGIPVSLSASKMLRGGGGGGDGEHIESDEDGEGNSLWCPVPLATLSPHHLGMRGRPQGNAEDAMHGEEEGQRRGCDDNRRASDARNTTPNQFTTSAGPPPCRDTILSSEDECEGVEANKVEAGPLLLPTPPPSAASALRLPVAQMGERQQRAAPPSKRGKVHPSPLDRTRRVVAKGLLLRGGPLSPLGAGQRKQQQQQWSPRERLGGNDAAGVASSVSNLSLSSPSLGMRSQMKDDTVFQLPSALATTLESVGSSISDVNGSYSRNYDGSSHGSGRYVDSNNSDSSTDNPRHHHHHDMSLRRPGRWQERSPPRHTQEPSQNGRLWRKPPAAFATRPQQPPSPGGSEKQCTGEAVGAHVSPPHALRITPSHQRSVPEESGRANQLDNDIFGAMFDSGDSSHASDISSSSSSRSPSVAKEVGCSPCQQQQQQQQQCWKPKLKPSPPPSQDNQADSFLRRIVR